MKSNTDLSVSECLDSYEARCDRDGVRGVAIPSILNHLRARFQDAPLSEVTSRDVEQMSAELLAHPYAPATVQAHIAYLRAAMHYAQKKGELTALPWFPSIKVENARRGFFERDEFERILACLPEPYADIARFGYSCGWRLSEILGLHWSEVDRERRIIRLTTSKNGHGRVLPIVGELVEILERAWRNRIVGDKLSEWVFHRAGHRIPNNRSWNVWNAARNHAGLTGRLFHDLRRTAARDMIAAGCDYQTAMAVTGHRTMSMFLRYQIVDMRGVQQGLRSLEAYRNGNGHQSAAA
jgi:integrase